ncbi:MAG: gingipain R, partial [Candidatus Cloacimonetes bacterium]|nr:gingipain R [Candidatus Cloacimonadota bacterium]
SGTISCDNPYVTIQNSAITYGNIAAGATVRNASLVIVDIAPSCPDGTPIRLVLQLSSQSGVQYTISEHIIVHNGRMTLVSQTVIDGQDAALDPDETAQLRFVLSNSGSSTLASLNAELTSASQFIAITNTTISYGTAVPSTQVQPSGNFSVYVNALCVPGMLIPMNLRVFNASGFEQLIPLSFTVGNVLVTDPLGPDAYGYLIYDVGDTGYTDHPVYAWTEISPAEGGSGTLLAISDVYNSSDEGDQVGADALEVVTLPFGFRFYGVQYNTITVCSNGFIALGVTGNAEFRNFRIPGAMGPNPMIAGFWDDLATSATAKVYSYYDAANHRFIVEWYKMLNGKNGTSEETFQIILYDHLYSSTSTGDGPILIQYKTFNNVDVQSSERHGNYCTIGIEDHTGTRGLEYTFNNIYPTAAAPLDNLRSLYLTTVPEISPAPVLSVLSLQHSDANSNGLLESDEEGGTIVTLENLGAAIATNVSVTLSSEDTNVLITTPSTSFNSIVAHTTAIGINSLQYTVSRACPNGHYIPFTLSITGGGITWTHTFMRQVYRADLAFGDIAFNDTTGDHDGILDPGESATVTVILNNIGGVTSPSGSATMSCATEGITVTNGSASYASIPSNGSANLTFTFTASSAMSIGTIVNLVFNATAGIYAANTSKSLEVGAPNEILIGDGSSLQAYPIDRYYNYSAHEAIYLASEIGNGGYIKAIAFKKGSGDDVGDIAAVSVYMKNTSEGTLNSGDYSLTGYTLVYDGTLINADATGWLEVNLDTMYPYNGVQNLQILCVKGYQLYTSSYNQYYYSTSTNRARQSHSDTTAPTNLSTTNNLPNIRFKIFPDNSILYPPSNLAAQGSNRTVLLTWQVPVIGIPTAYNIYRNSSLVATVTDLNYYDVDVANGNTYSYYVKAVYSTEESSATAAVQATPNSTSVASATIGTDTIVSSGSYASPINLTYKSSHGQSVYTVAELNAAGIYGPIQITQLGFYIVSAPNLALPNFLIRMKHTSDANVVNWQTATGMQTVYTNTAYMPTIGGYDMLTFNTPFTWNGTSNIVIDTAFGLVENWSNSGTIQYSNVTNGYRYTWSDTVDQTNNYSGTYSPVTRRPNIKISVPAAVESAIISMPVTPLSFGSIVEGSTSVQQITISNTGNQVLAGYITCPTGYSVEVARNSASISAKETDEVQTRAGYHFTVNTGASKTFDVTFSPVTQGTFSGNLVITTNSSTNSVLNRPVSGSATPATLATPQAHIQQNGASVLIQWTDIANANHYEVWKSSSPEGPFTMVATPTLPQYIDLSADRAFFYIKAISTPLAKQRNE